VVTYWSIVYDPRSDVFVNYFLDYFSTTTAKVLWFSLDEVSLLSLSMFLFPVIELVTWMTTGPSCRHLLYTYKLTTCSFVYMGIGKAGPSSLL
jgi:hypothetical protein